jgi:hypothetical protein
MPVNRGETDWMVDVLDDWVTRAPVGPRRLPLRGGATSPGSWSEDWPVTFLTGSLSCWIPLPR